MTTAVTAQALERGRDIAIELYEQMLARAASRLSISDQILALPEPHQTRVRAIAEGNSGDRRNPNELF